jgi:hypothetical protein
MGQPAYVTVGKSLSHRLRAASLGEAETSHADDYTQSGIMVPAYEDAHHTTGPELYSPRELCRPHLSMRIRTSYRWILRLEKAAVARDGENKEEVNRMRAEEERLVKAIAK